MSSLGSVVNVGIDLFSALAKSDVVRGMVLQAARDVFITRTDRDKGFNEYKYAREGDDLEVIGEDTDNPDGGFRVINRDNYDQIETVQMRDLEDTFNEYGK
ncbi:hypothetical protein AVT69_gp325 [Pseudomonas phage PhiPA3]|uniref:Uncharacterized protein 327 n=1 Tax=Pseudomonas phage PhiPA3 TaxID=998086 RepID=F8SJG3_BPPA3|nr:hypothetical protein AVT69_gp325 [Pseudomonas phage PhiPA3]AEH03750.1 hypothetical protein [Pseudomonas phage PhiPA3]